jgi:tetratricopeptide (TPR) repeat protein
MFFHEVGDVKTQLVPLLLGATYRMLGEFNRAENVLQEALKAHPDDAELMFNLGLVYLDQGRRIDLIRLMQTLLTVDGGAANAKLLTGLCYLRHGDLNIARQLIDELVASEPELVRARMLRVELLSRALAPLEDQIRAINDILRLDPASFEARNWLNKVRQIQAARVPAAIPTSPLPMPAMAPALAS